MTINRHLLAVGGVILIKPCVSGAVAKGNCMSFELDNLTTSELEELIVEAKALIAEKQEYAIQAAYVQMVQLASGLGLSVDDVILRARRSGNSSRAEKTKKSVAPRYRNPNNQSETWTGRGRAPRWVAALQAQGLSLDELRTQA